MLDQIVFIAIWALLVLPGGPLILLARMRRDMSGRMFLVIWGASAFVGFILLENLNLLLPASSTECLPRHVAAAQC